MKAVNKRKKSLLLYVNLFSRFAGGRERGTILGKRYRGKQKRRSEWKERRAYRRERKEGGGGIFRENRFQVPDSRSGKRLLFQRNFYIYPLVKRKPRICFYSRILLVTSHSGFPFLFFFLSLFSSLFFFFNARHVLLPSPESLLHATRSLILAIFSTSRSANSSRSGRASVHRSGGVVVYFVPVWIDLLAACLPQHGETFRSPRNWSSPREKEGNGERERLYFRMCRAKYERNSSTGEDEDRPR